MAQRCHKYQPPAKDNLETLPQKKSKKKIKKPKKHLKINCTKNYSHHIQTTKIESKYIALGGVFKKNNLVNAKKDRMKGLEE